MKVSLSSVLRIAALLTVTVFPWSGCFETPYDPSGGGGTTFNPNVSVKTGDWQEVPATGGAIDFEQLSLNFPAGAFNGDSKVAVSTVKNNPFSDYTTLSNAYQVAFPSEGTNKPVSLSIPYDGDPDDVVMLVNTPTWSQHTMNMAESVFPIDFSVANGLVNAIIPATGNAEGKTPYFQVGLVANEALGSGTKAEDDKKAFVREGAFALFDGTPQRAYYGAVPEDVKQFSQLFSTFVSDYIPKAFTNLKSVGFELPQQRVSFKIQTFGKDDAWGYSESSAFYNEWGYIRLNGEKIKELSQQSPYSADLVGQIQQTLVHELFHTVHDWVYDINRSPWQRASEGAEGDHWAMLSEAIGCWVEKTTGDKKIGENCIAFADNFLTSFWPQERSSTVYQNHGYGMGLFIEWLARKTSDRKIVKLVEYQRGGEKSLPNAFDRFLAEEKLEFFKPDIYFTFATSVVAREFDDRIKTEHLVGSNVKAVKSLPDNYTSDIWPYGVNVTRLGFSGQIWDKSQYDVQTITLTQDREDLVSAVYLDTGKSCDYLGGITKDKPFRCPMSVLKEAGVKYFTIVTARSAKEDKGGQMVSRVNVEMNFRVSYITFESGKYRDSWSAGSSYGIDVDQDLNVSADNGESRIYLTINVSNGKIGDLTGIQWSAYNSYSGSYSTSRLSLKSISGSSGSWASDVCQISLSF